MSNIKFKMIYGSRDNLLQRSYTQGQVMLVKDSQQIIFNIDGSRRSFYGIIYLATQQDRTQIQQPDIALYLVMQSGKLYYYGEEWKQLSNGGTDALHRYANFNQLSALTQCDENSLYLDQSTNQLYIGVNLVSSVLWISVSGSSDLSDYSGNVNLKNSQNLNILNNQNDVITLGDVADVFMTDNSAEIYANLNGTPGVMLQMQKQTGYSTGDVSDRILEEFEEMLEEDERLELITLMDQGIYIDLVMDSIINNIVFGAGLAILILILFLKDIRPTLVIAVSIPVSLVAAIVCMYFSGVTLNIISLSGLALGIGMLVDNSIVVIENIYRLRSEGYSMQEAAVEGAKEVGGAIVASTLTTVCVFLPIVFTDGITRQLFVDMGLTIAYSLLASLIIALTVVPAMSSRILTKTKTAQDSKLFTGFINGYGKLLSLALKAKSLVLILAVALLVISVAAAWTNGTAFMSEMDSTQLTDSVQAFQT